MVPAPPPGDPGGELTLHLPPKGREGPPTEGDARPPIALTIAGSDSGGGAGIQADLKTFTVLRCYGMSVVTAITAQNTLGVQASSALDPELVRQQMDSVLGDIGADAAKTGMLANAGVVEAVADGVRAHGLSPLVVDPVMVAKGGAPLLAPEAREAVIRLLLPLATVITPNLPEAEALTGLRLETPEAVREAARRLHDLGPAWVVMKSGHRPGRWRSMWSTTARASTSCGRPGWRPPGPMARAAPSRRPSPPSSPRAGRCWRPSSWPKPSSPGPSRPRPPSAKATAPPTTSGPWRSRVGPHRRRRAASGGVHPGWQRETRRRTHPAARTGPDRASGCGPPGCGAPGGR